MNAYLSVLDLVHTDHLVLFASSEMKARDEVDDLGKKSRNVRPIRRSK